MSIIHSGETAEYKIFWDEVTQLAAERGEELMLASADIKRLKYQMEVLR